jgi:tetratricopeptide (TPR) repeat protein
MMKNLLDEIAALARDSRFDDAVAMIDGLEAQGFTSPQLQVLKGTYLQLGASGKYSLDDVEEAFRRAIDLDPDSAEAHIDLGWFLCRVVEDTVQARSCFEEALRLATDLRNEARTGLAECDREQRQG